MFAVIVTVMLLSVAVLRDASERALGHTADSLRLLHEVIDAATVYFGAAMQREPSSLTADECHAFARAHSRQAADAAHALFAAADADRFGRSATQLADLKSSALGAIAALHAAPSQTSRTQPTATSATA